jgi:ribosomal protein L37E
MSMSRVECIPTMCLFSRTNKTCSEGYLQLWQASQQDAHALPALWSVSPLDLQARVDWKLVAKSCRGREDKSLTRGIWATGRRSYHIQKSTCGSCGYPAAKMRKCMTPLAVQQIYIRLSSRCAYSEILTQTTGARRLSDGGLPAPAGCAI